MALTLVYCTLSFFLLSSATGQGRVITWRSRYTIVIMYSSMPHYIHAWSLSGGLYIRGNLRLVNSTHNFAESAGRLEFYDDSRKWKSICISGFGQDEALLACKQLGYKVVESYGTVAQLGWVLKMCCHRLSWKQNMQLAFAVSFCHNMHNAMEYLYHKMQSLIQLDSIIWGLIFPRSA